jgi:hypothetical protein
MVWCIPLTDLAGALAVSFVSGPPVQRPTSPPVLPDAPPPVTSTEDPMPPSEPSPPVLPPAEPPIADPPPPTTTTTATADPFVETRPPRRPLPATEATDDERAPIVGGTAGVPAKERLLRPTDKRRFFSLTAGGATPSSFYTGYYSAPSGMDFQAEMAVGAHGINRPNFGGAFVLQYRKGFLTELTFAGRVQWDRPLSKAFAIYSATDLTLGLNLPIGYGGYLQPMIPNALITLGWGLKAILAERFLLIFKPVGPGLLAPAYSQIRISFRWELGGGIGIVW